VVSPLHTEQDDRIARFPGADRVDDRRPITVAIAGSRELKSAPETLFSYIRDLPAGSLILLRRGMKSKPGLFELTLAKYIIAYAPRISYEWCLPDPEGGRQATYVRDVQMTRRADLVLCFFATESMSGGTEHVVEKAMDALVPVYSWGFNGSNFIRIGEHDPDNVWADDVPWV
jgi:hypothetical protein